MYLQLSGDAMSAMSRDDNPNRFVTFSCYRRRHLLGTWQARRIVLDALRAQLLRRHGCCSGFVVMPGHVHALLWIPPDEELSVLVQQWKRVSSFRLRRHIKEELPRYAAEFDVNDPIWQAGYNALSVSDPKKAANVRNYMHRNPVERELVDSPGEWEASSYAYYEDGAEAPVPMSIE